MKSLKDTYRSDAKQGQFIRFCINGVLAVGIQYAVYLVLICCGVNEYVSNTVGYVISFCCNFVITSFWTFRSRPSLKKLGGFGSSHIVNYFVQQAFLALYLWLSVPKEFAALIAMASAVPINFTLLHFVYKKKK